MTHKVTILGAGIVGLCTALSLAERGIATRVIDRRAPGRETSYGNAGVISPWSVIPQAMPGIWRQIPHLMFGAARPLSVHPKVWPRMIPWGLRFLWQGSEARVRASADAMELLCGPSIELYRRHLAGTKGAHLITDSLYVHAFRDGSRATLDSLDYAIRREKGAEIELIGADHLRRIEPALTRDFAAAILVGGQARARSPGQICDLLAEKAKGLGVEFVTDSAQRIERDGQGWSVIGRTGRYTSEKVVVALGVWSASLLTPLGLRLPLMAERGYHLEFSEPGVEVNNSVLDVDAKLVASSMTGGLRLAGQAEFAPIDAPVDPRKQRLLERLGRAMFPELNTTPAQLWMGRRPSFPDSRPALGAIAGLDGLYANFGHSHYGLMMAPKSGEILADVVGNRPLNVDLAPFSVHRFA
ncbi:NAD(P)/FAD-dependent oxidoreductase [Roseobacter sinensis]|uniref:FAD-dependent oxidoreductase n=1 Tax=Roseobacter sinensis TaxID=2931391 RepID=A0ABT3BGC6_9RHOB|nr:FAD-dependent oxidoreductase [Roseobacter sp. WL0113]MCV3272159.1 FAD-dependent oxidoreductase [Roseobacter sp. WL0113]